MICDIGAYELGLFQADMTVTKTDNPDPVIMGNNLTYTLTVINNGPDDATGVVVSDLLPAEVSYVSATPSQGSCSESSGTLTCNLQDLVNGNSASVEISVYPATQGIITNTASVSACGSDPDESNNNVSEDTMVSPPPKAMPWLFLLL